MTKACSISALLSTMHFMSRNVVIWINGLSHFDAVLPDADCEKALKCHNNKLCPGKPCQTLIVLEHETVF